MALRRSTNRSRRAKKVLAELRAAAKDATDIYVATDPDREGEAIGWHLAEELGDKKKKIHRLMFNEITKKAVQEAMKHPGTIDLKMVDAQQARRVLDRLVGYKISPMLWDKVRRGLSAGRVQSVALKLICDREKEIAKFVPEEYWLLFATLAGPQPPEFEAKLVKKGDETIKVGNELESQQVLRDLEGAAFTVVVGRDQRAQAQRGASVHHQQAPADGALSRSSGRCRSRSSSTKASSCRAWASKGRSASLLICAPIPPACPTMRWRRFASTSARSYGAEYVPEKPNVFKTKADAQDAHEAIRPTSMEYDPEKVRPFLTPEQYSLYRLIWNRFVASQMPPATFDETTVDIKAGDYLFRVKGTVPKFPGWLAAYGQIRTETRSRRREKDKDDEDDAASGVLPPLAEGDRLELKALRPGAEVHAAAAAIHRSDAGEGAGRKRHRPPEHLRVDHRRAAGSRLRQQGRRDSSSRRALGMIITDLLIKSFDDILDVEYTRSLEEDLDRIEQGKADYKGTLTTFYKKFKKDLAKAGKEMQNLKEGIKTEEICDRCGKRMVIKVGKFGPFVACSGYPDCTNTRELEKSEPG